MTNSELCAAISRLTGDSLLTTERVIKGMRQVIMDEMACLGTVHLAGIGKFQGLVRGGRVHPNGLNLGAVEVIEPRVTFRFYPSERARENLAVLDIPKRR